MGLYSGFPDRWPISLVFFREQEAEAWAELVWPSERGEEENLEKETAEAGGAKTPKVTFKDYDPDDPVYREGPRSYSPHWARALLKPTTQKQQQSPPKLTEEHTS